MFNNYTNKFNLPLPMAMWLVHSDYHNPADYSVTQLINSTRQIILSKRYPELQTKEDITQLFHRSLGNAIHSRMEAAWADPETIAKAVEICGLAEETAKLIEINPKPGFDPDLTIPVYVEQRNMIEIGGKTISGAFDIVFDGQLIDMKSTRTSAYVQGYKDEDWALQGSYYRMINPKLITEDTIHIYFLFKDFSHGYTGKEGYPPAVMYPKAIPLLPIEETRVIAEAKIAEIKFYDKPEISDFDLPYCSAKELKAKDPVYKYYSRLGLKRASAVSTSLQEMLDKQESMGGGGYIDRISEVPFSCTVCPVKSKCNQYGEIINELVSRVTVSS